MKHAQFQLPIDVTCAIIIQADQVLAAKRNHHMERSGFWEFPGGKIEHGENSQTCLHREINEELQIHIQIIQPLTPIIHHYKDKSIRLIPFLSMITEGDPIAQEHETIQWFQKDELLQLNWSPADIPIVKEFLSLSL